MKKVKNRFTKINSVLFVAEQNSNKICFF